MRQWEKTEYQQLNKDGKHQVEHFDDFSSRKVCKVKILLTVLNCQVIKAKSKWSKLSFFWAKSWKTQKDEKKRKVEKSKKKKKHQSSQARRFMFEKSKKNENSKSREVQKPNTFWFFAKSFTWKVEKSESQDLSDFLLCEKITRKVGKKTKVENFLTFYFLRKVLQFSRCAITGERSA